ncbi:threonylcarbamoyl-AMP synthase [Caldichromatium japonicum]|uniref:Threonylcarbamoyl-AMP synthase n=1 Tax=Caldichromatium japonicum TaxID=2699430 RepID=A0A6G7VEA7_9GAMM|nr:L-threonylcarbamoyladenylate synthase [Caldichromatium japonicum]QIK38127.1 threonylcarbamoyl-AMP synthase [Caldichromatium japonicum]
MDIPTRVETTPAQIQEAAAILRRGGVVAFPTETVYGLGADARQETAVRRVFAIKGRPADHPLIVHLASAEGLRDWAQAVPEAAWVLAERFWPGPLTLVLPRAAHVLDAVTGGQTSVALRVPAHPLALALIRAAGPLVAPSANRFGRLSPTCAEHVKAELGKALDLILDGGPCRIGVESTILSLLDDTPRILRPGVITPEAIETVLGRPVAMHGSRVRAPGTLSAHYAPRTPLVLLLAQEVPQQTAEWVAQGWRVAVLGCGEPAGRWPAGVQRLALPDRPAEYACGLYASLRALDAAGVDLILVEEPPLDPAWLAVQDRLRRAAATFSKKGSS